MRDGLIWRGTLRLPLIGATGMLIMSCWFQGSATIGANAGGAVSTGPGAKDPTAAGGKDPHHDGDRPGGKGENEEEEAFYQDYQRYYVAPRAYPRQYVDGMRRVKAFDELAARRKKLKTPKVNVGWAGQSGPGVPGARDAGGCAWSSVGPTNINGRITGIAVDPGNRQRLFASTVGGIWRSTDRARKWERVSDDLLAAVTSTVAINPGNGSEIFVGTGDPNYATYAFASWGGGQWGNGILRSTANGDIGSWSKVTPTDMDGRTIFSVVVDPTSPNNVYAATSGGVYLGARTSATSALTWSRLGGFDAWTTGLAVDFSATPRRVYAGVAVGTASYARGIWKYDGTTWNRRDTGITFTSSRTIALDLAASSTAILYARVEKNDGHLLGVYKTTTGGETPTAGGNAWTALPGTSTLDDSCASGFCYSWYNSLLRVDPADPSTVWTAGRFLYRTTTGGAGTSGGWTNVSNGTDTAYQVYAHDDHHTIAFDPTSSKLVYDGNDGGLDRSTDASQTAWHWNDVSHGMVITEFYRLTSQQATASLVAGGSQDNGTEITFGNRTWYNPGGCDGADVAVDGQNSSTLYGNCNGGLFELANPVPPTVGGGSTITWTAPAGTSVVPPLVTDPSVAKAALSQGSTSTSKVIVKTTDGKTWTTASPSLGTNRGVTFIAVAPSSSFQTYYVGVVDTPPSGTAPTNAPSIWRTTTGGGTAATAWTSASTGLPALAAQMQPNGIAIDATNASRAFVAYGGAGGGDVLVTTDGGANWTSVKGTGASALPTTSVTGIVLDPANGNLLYIATDIGPFRGTFTPAAGATPASATWAPMDEGLPTGLDVNDIWVNRPAGILYIGTAGHGAYQRDIRPGATCPGAMLVVRDSVIDRGSTPSASGVPDPEHPIAAGGGFYKPDDTEGGKMYWWQSTDIRIDVPSLAPAANKLELVDSVEAESCPIELSSCPAGTLLDVDPKRGTRANAHVQVGNRGLAPATNVRVIALWADATAALPDLPGDFWSTTFPAGTTSCGALTAGSGWNLVNPAQPCRVIPAVNPEYPETAEFDWDVANDAPEHSCLLTIVESADDPIDASVRTSNEVRTWTLVPGDRHVANRNLHVVDGPPGGAPVRGMETMGLPGRSAERFTLVVSRAGMPKDASLRLFLPPEAGKSKQQGLRTEQVEIDPKRRELAAKAGVDPSVAYRIEGQEGTVYNMFTGGAGPGKMLIEYDSGSLPPNHAARFSIITRQGDRVLGGSTYVLRVNR